MLEIYLRIRGLNQSFKDHQVLRGIDMEIFRGETLVIIGSSGGGKSVLLKHLAGLLRPTSGSIELAGVEISTLTERELGPIRQQMGVLFQGGALFDSLTVAENIAFPLREMGGVEESQIDARIAEVLAIVGLHGHDQKLPAELSGGMRKRVALARAVVTRPACVLYDEPHAGLDPQTADSIDHLIKNLQRTHGITSVVVTHEMKSIFHIADRVIFLENGRVAWTGTTAELQASQNPELRAFVEGDSGEAWE